MSGEDLKRLRLANSLTQTQLAEMVNAEFETTIRKKDLSNWEGGTREMTKLYSFAFKQVFQKLPVKE